MSIKKKDKIWLFAIGAGILAILAGGIAAKIFQNRETAVMEAARIEREEKDREKEEEEREAAKKAAEEQGSRILGFAADSVRSVTEAMNRRPPLVELTEENTEEFAHIHSCKIDGRRGKIIIEASAEGIPVSDDKFYYLFALKSHEKELEEDSICLKQEYKGEEVRFQVEKNAAGIGNTVFDKFVMAVKKDDEYVMVSNSCYIMNLEETAKYASEVKKASTKKGLLVDPNKLRTSELDDLGVKHAAYNIPVSRILGQTTSGIHPTIHYSYNGKTYAFNGQVMSEYDLVFGTLSAKGIEVTAIILNDVSSAYPQTIHPMARGGIGRAPYYAFNADDEAGAECLAAIGSFLAERYSSSKSGRGLVTNWVIGNEINARKEWNYMEYVDLETYVREYAEAFRIFYNAIKSTNKSCNVYISLDQQWNRDNPSTQDYDAKDILDEFNRQIKGEGDIGWGLAIHPYNVPLTTPYIWNSSKYVKDSPDTPMVTMANIHVVTDYMQQEQFLTEDGEVRSIILSELGYTSLKGEEVQAAAIAYAYKSAEANPHIDSILFSRQTDAAEEIAQGLAMGLNRMDGSHKYAYNVYKNMDTDQGENYIGFAKNIIGISDWSQIAKNH
ncbi:MAG TPA: hypothetical protein DCZ40_09825 [Lachnospiraceae bacterium]|nr:hypothetical protein [Lachnospiraceae bacterium]